MNKPGTLPLISLLCLLWIGNLLIGCNSETEPSTDQPLPQTAELTEDALPKGRTVIDDSPAYPTNGPVKPVGPISGPVRNDTEVPSGQEESASESRPDFLKKVYKNLLIFHADDTMEVNKTKLATLILARDQTGSKIKMEVLEESNASDERVHLDTTMDFGSKMSARLIALGGSRLDNSFEIEALGGDEQSFRNNRKKLVWQWKITPLKEGQHELKLSIQIIEKDGESVYLPAKNIPVVIFAKEESFFTRMGNFFSNKYEWLITAILLPIFIAVLTTRIRNRNNTANIQHNAPTGAANSNQPGPPTSEKTS